MLEQLSAGGQMALTQQIDNYPGYEEGVDGFDLAEKMQRQAEHFGAKTEYAQVERMELTAEPKVLETSEGTFLGPDGGAGHRGQSQRAGSGNEAALVGRGVGLLCRLQWDALQGQDGGCGGRGQLRRRGRPAAEPDCPEGDPGPPPGHLRATKSTMRP